MNEIKIEFFDREKEKEEILKVLKAEPDLINFVFGPINSGKTELMRNFLTEISEEKYHPIYINLRKKFLSNHKDFIQVLFKVRKEVREELRPITGLISLGLRYAGIPISKETLDEILRSNREDAFEYIYNYFISLRQKNKIPIFVLDELQKLKDIRIDGSLLYELFNFFIDLTKQEHISHVFAITSDSLFLEKIYSEAMLQGRVNYLLIDDFDQETTFAFLEKYGFKEMEKNLIWHYIGGKPIMLKEVIKTKILGMKVEEKCMHMLKLRESEIEDMLDELKYKDKFEIKGEMVEVKREDIVNLLKIFLEKECIAPHKVNRFAMYYLVKKNLLFVNPLEGVIKLQSRLDLLAIEKILKEEGL